MRSETGAWVWRPLSIGSLALALACTRPDKGAPAGDDTGGADTDTADAEVPVVPAACATAPVELRFTEVASSTSTYATFQSHNQKILETPDGIFLTYVSSQDTDGSSTWVLARSVDGGASFSTVWTATAGTNVPTLESDASGDLYLIHSESYLLPDQPATIYHFTAGSDYTEPEIWSVPGGSGSKFTTLLDREREQIYLATYWDELDQNFFVIGLDGAVRSSLRLQQPGALGAVQYPLLAMSGETLYAAWTTDPLDGSIYYRGAQLMRSPDGGLSWELLDGTPLETPVIADEEGPTHDVVLDDELDVDTWLYGFLPTERAVHLLYYARPPVSRQHYVRFDAATGERDLDVFPTFSGDTLGISSWDGFLTAGAGASAGDLFAVGSNGADRLTVLTSADEGESWQDCATSPAVPSTHGIYAIGGARTLTEDGRLLGTFTRYQWSGAPHEVVFFSADLDGDG